MRDSKYLLSKLMVIVVSATEDETEQEWQKKENNLRGKPLSVPNVCIGSVLSPPALNYAISVVFSTRDGVAHGTF